VLLTLRVDDNFRRRKNNPKEAKDIVFFIYSINIDNKNRKKKIDYDSLHHQKKHQ